jgi:hypothetical protein
MVIIFLKAANQGKNVTLEGTLLRQILLQREKVTIMGGNGIIK